MYRYEDFKEKLFTEKGQEDFLRVRDHVHKLLKEAGAFMIMHGLRKSEAADSWLMIANIDRLVELKEIREITQDVAGQHRVFVAYNN